MAVIIIKILGTFSIKRSRIYNLIDLAGARHRAGSLFCSSRCIILCVPPRYGFRYELVLFFVLIFFPIFSYADDNPWYEGFFLEGSAIYYFAPEMFKEYMDTKPGFRGAVGYEFMRIRFAVESGYSHIAGTNPLVKEVTLIPLVFKFGYALPLISVLGLQADLCIGTAFSNTLRYETVIDIILNNLLDDYERSLLTGARLYVTISPLNFLKIYLGGGIDVIFETEGPVPLPLVEAGLSIKPGAMVNKFLNLKNNKPKTVYVHFEENSIFIDRQYIPVLDEIGQKLKDNDSLHVILYSYYAPKGTQMQVRYTTGEPALATTRAGFCVEYLAENYEIDSSRIKIEYRNAVRKTELYTCVEIIVK